MNGSQIPTPSAYRASCRRAERSGEWNCVLDLHIESGLQCIIHKDGEESHLCRLLKLYGVTGIQKPIKVPVLFIDGRNHFLKRCGHGKCVRDWDTLTEQPQDIKSEDPSVVKVRTHLWFERSKTLMLDPAMPEEPSKDTMTVPAAPERAVVEKANINDHTPTVTIVAIPLVTEIQLNAATGGAELSCYRCTVPFGVVILIAGIVVTSVAYSFNSHGSTISYFGLVLLSAGLVLLALSAVCWKMRLERKKERRRESQTALVANQRSIFA